MSFHNVRLDEDVEKGAIGGPEFRTLLLELSSGFEKRNVEWERARGKWDLSYGMDTKANQEAVLAFFYARYGRAYGFRFKDWTDYQVGSSSTDTPQEVGTGTGSADKFQAYRRYTSGAYTFNRPLTRLVSGTVRVFLDGVEQMSGWTVDVDTGVITFTAAPGLGVSVGVICEFDVPVRFDMDHLPIEAERDDAFAYPEVPIVELKESLASLA